MKRGAPATDATTLLFPSRTLTLVTMTSLPLDELLEQMLSNKRIRREDFDAFTYRLRQERFLAPRTTHSCYQLTMQGNVTICYRMAPSQIEAIYNVFNTAEILEQILVFLHPLDQLRAREICKGFQRAIDASPQIRRNMYRKSDPLRQPAFIPYCVRGLSSRITQARGNLSLSMQLNREACLALKRSKFMRGILLAQPPPRSVTVRRDCECDEPGKLDTADCGYADMTFGHVLSAIASLGQQCGICGSFLGLRVNARISRA